MFILRRTALRAAISASKPMPSVIVPNIRTFVSLNQSRLRPSWQWNASSLQKRFASDGATPSEKELTDKAKEEVVAEVAADAVAAEAAEAAEVVPEAGSASAEAAEPAVVEEVVADAVPETEVASAETSAPSSTKQAASNIAATVAGGATAASAAASAPATPKFSSPLLGASGGLPAPNNTLYVGNIFFEVNEQSLQQYFERFGPIKSTRVVYDSRGLSKGFGYVQYENIDDATRAVEAANQQVFQGRRLAVQFHRPRVPINRRQNGATNTPTKTLFIGNMSFEMSDKDLSDLFREVRNVVDVRIAIDRRTGTPRGFAHADFLDAASATRAMEYLQGKEIYGRALRVDYSETSRNAQKPA